MKNKMVWKLAVCFAAVLLLFTGILGTVFVSMFRQHTIAINRTSMEKRALSIAETLASFTSGGGMGMGRGGRGGYGAYLRFLDQLAMAEVWIVDENLNLLTPGHGQQTSYASLPENAEQIVGRVFQGETTYGEDFSDLLQVPTLTVGTPIRTADGVIGAVLLHSPVGGVNEAVHQGIYALTAGAVVALLFAGAAAVWLSYRFTDPLRRMTAAALRLAEGDYAAKTGVIQEDEIGGLAKTIDLLSGRLLEAQQERTALEQLKQDFTANVSHELRTPVAVLRGSLEVLMDGTVSSPGEISEYYGQMLSESRHLERLVNDLLDLSRLQDAKFQLETGEVNLCDVVRDGARAMRRAAECKQLHLSLLCPDQECLVVGDYGRIRQMLLILLDNAIKFSSEDSEVTLILEDSKDGYALSVTDHGAGIRPEELPSIFERFRKARTMQNRSGTGLGLPIAKQIADRHKADLGVESENGSTRFWIHFQVERG